MMTEVSFWCELYKPASSGLL